MFGYLKVMPVILFSASDYESLNKKQYNVQKTSFIIN